MELTATQTGVDDNQVQIIDNPRNSMLADIAARARTERDEEIRSTGEQPVDTTGAEPEVKPDEPETVVTEEAPVVEAKEPETVQPPQEDYVTVKIDGEVRQVPKDKIFEAGIRAVQKESTADKRLEEATRLLREAQQTLAPQPQKNADPSPQWDDQTIAYAIANGTEEQQQEAARQILERQRNQPTPDSIAQTVTAHVLDTVDFQTSVEWFKTEYKDVVSDPYLLQLAAAKEQQLRTQGDSRPRRELFKEIGDDLRKWKGGTATAAPAALDNRKDKKAEIVSLPSASVRQQAPETPKPKTASDIIEDMRKRRGQV